MLATMKEMVSSLTQNIKSLMEGRSPKWVATRRKFLLKHSKCEACGNTTNLNVHHIIPFHIKSDLELDENNLITLCENSHINGTNCHFIFGHGGDWKAYIPNVIEIVKLIYNAIQNRQYN